MVRRSSGVSPYKEEPSPEVEGTRPQGNERPRLLVLCQTLPFPPDGGVNIRAYHILQLLSKRFRVSALCFFSSGKGQVPGEVEKGVEGLGHFVEVEAFPIPQGTSRLRFLWDHLRSVLFRRAYTVFMYESTEFRQRLENLLKTESFSLVHIDSLDLSGSLRSLAGVPVVCAHHNIESDLLRRRAESERSWLRRVYIRHQAKLTRKEEQLWCGKVNLNITVSPRDRHLLQEISPEANSVVVPNGVDSMAYTPSSGETSGVVFVGGYTWYPNREGMEYFSREILPHLREKDPLFSVQWVGRAPSTVMERYRRRFGVEMTGYVEDVRPFFSRAACFVVPLRVGGGTRLKVLYAWAMGKAVVSTSLGCEGLNARDGENILIRDNPSEFAEAVWTVCHSQALRRGLERAARETAEREYDWEVIGADMLGYYEELL